MQATRARSLLQEGPTCCGATQPRCHNHWAYALEPKSHEYWSLSALQPVLHKRSHCSEKAVHCNWRVAPLSTAGEKPAQQRRPSATKEKENLLKKSVLFPTFKARNCSGHRERRRVKLQWGALRGGSLPPWGKAPSFCAARDPTARTMQWGWGAPFTEAGEE